MYIQDIIGELLYIGIVAEKGRCYGVRWKFGYKKVLKKHIWGLAELQKCLQSSNSDVVLLINNFVRLCNSNTEIGKLYFFSSKGDNELNIRRDGKNFNKTNKLMEALFEDLKIELNRLFIHKRKVYNLLCALHNLPRVYLGENKKTLCELKQQAICEEDAIKYSFQNMDDSMREKYQNLF